MTMTSRSTLWDCADNKDLPIIDLPPWFATNFELNSLALRDLDEEAREIYL